METFGTRLARLRKECNLTQQDIADKLNISYQAISKWENDLTSPDIDCLIELSNILNVSLDELLGKEDTKVSYSPISERKDINKLMFKIIVNSSDGDQVNINLPIAAVKIFANNSSNSIINGNKALEGIDFKQLLDLVEQGIIGEIVNINSSDGDKVRIVVE